MHISRGRIQGQPSGQRTATFTGTVHVDPVLNAPDLMINTVIFTPGARTYWAEPGEEHWHGACADTLLTHLAVSHGPTEWGGAVEPNDYTTAQS